DRQTIAFVRLHFIEQPVDDRRIQRDGQDAVLETVVVEDVGETHSQDGAKAIVEYGPGGMLAAGTATEVFARQQNLRAFITGLVQGKLRILPPAGGVLAQLARIQKAQFV